MRLLILILTFAAAALSQVSIYGTTGTVGSNYWANPALAYGPGLSFTHGRATVGGEAWRAEADRQRNPWLSSDRRAEAVLGFVAFRAWRGLHAEGGGGVQRITDATYGPLIAGTRKYSAPFGHAGGYYQLGGRFFARVGGRRLFVRDDHDTWQVYTSIGVQF